jgi:chemotaxis protein MotB
MKSLMHIPMVAVLFAASACVSQDRYDLAVKDAEDARAKLAALSKDAAQKQAQATTDVAKLNDALKTAGDEMRDRDERLTKLTASSTDLQKKLDAMTAEDAQLRKELDRLGKNADKLLTEKGTLSSALDQAKARLEELRKAQAAADARTALFRQLALKFHKMIDAGQLKIALRDGRMVIELSTDVLFDSGRTDIKPGGNDALAHVAAVLKTIDGRHFQVAGHTDNVPIHTGRFPSNWELSTARAVEVVRYLVSQGLKPGVVSAAGYGEFDPIAANDTDAGRTKNRRIEITLQPNIDELVAVPDAK